MGAKSSRGFWETRPWLCCEWIISLNNELKNITWTLHLVSPVSRAISHSTGRKRRVAAVVAGYTYTRLVTTTSSPPPRPPAKVAPKEGVSSRATSVNTWCHKDPKKIQWDDFLSHKPWLTLLQHGCHMLSGKLLLISLLDTWTAYKTKSIYKQFGEIFYWMSYRSAVHSRTTHDSEHTRWRVQLSQSKTCV